MRVFTALAVLLIAGFTLPGCPKSAARPDNPDGNDLPPAVASIEYVSDPTLADFYLSFADVIERDGNNGSGVPVIKTTGQLRTAYMRGGRLAIQATETPDKYPGLAEKIDEIIADWIGLEDVPLTTERRREVVECFRAVSHALK